jgi:hypothetical protein
MPGDGRLTPAAVEVSERGAAAPATAETAAPTGRVATWRAGLREHWLAAALIGIGAILRVMAQFAYRPALFYIDSVKYLYNAEGNDPEGYKGPLRAILAISNLNTVIALQHLLGLAMAVVIYRLLLRRGVGRWLAALAIAPLLLDAYQLQMEQTIMPGTLFEALIVAGLAVLLWRPDQRGDTGGRPPGPAQRGDTGGRPPGLTPSWRAVIVAGLILGTSATVAQVGEALILPAAFYLLVAGGGWRHAIGKAAVMIVACAVPILAYCTGSYVATGDFFLSHSGVTSFYGRTAAAVDCKTIKLTPIERGICPDAAEQARGNDWLEFAPNAPVQAYYDHLPRAEVDKAVTDFSRAVVMQQPVRVLKAYLRDVFKIYSVTRQTDRGDAPISRWQFRTAFPYFSPHATKAEVDGVVRQFGGGLPRVWQPVADFLRSYQLDGGYTPGPLLLLFSLTGLFGSVAALMRRRLDHATAQLALASLLFFVSAAGLLLVSDLFVFSWRYQIPALVSLVPGGVLGIAVVARLIRNWRTERSGAALAEPAVGGAELAAEG